MAAASVVGARGAAPHEMIGVHDEYSSSAEQG
jgi:hypothetical protein